MLRLGADRDAPDRHAERAGNEKFNDGQGSRKIEVQRRQSQRAEKGDAERGNRDATRANQQERVHEPPNSLKKRRLEGQRLANDGASVALNAPDLREKLTSLVTDGFGRPSWPPVH